MKQIILMTAFLMLGLVNFSHAAETVGEKVEATADDAGRALKKGEHRVEEKLCTEGNAKCAAKKVKHRAEEAKDYMKDKTKEMKNDVDNK